MVYAVLFARKELSTVIPSDLPLIGILYHDGEASFDLRYRDLHVPLPLWEVSCRFHGIVNKVPKYDAQIRSVKGHLLRDKYIAFHVNPFFQGKGIFIVAERVYDKVSAAGHFIFVDLVIFQYGIDF